MFDAILLAALLAVLVLALLVTARWGERDVSDPESDSDWAVNVKLRRRSLCGFQAAAVVWAW
ncbi:hypothetical protein GCM10023152_30960 [Agromyces bauzanensis]|uniref:Uncharacterized protein n=1 Tax=Agromyces bauzanensis TaxID=1308924 RepID=A0A917UUJ9_9MICO|nr:hypothetical protein GCM10011372_25590 [Agromyces bauzanensis]